VVFSHQGRKTEECEKLTISCKDAVVSELSHCKLRSPKIMMHLVDTPFR